jgi:hypothetical protein
VGSEEVTPPSGRPLAVDQNAASADPSAPAFVARPEGAPVYHGFPLLEDVEVDGFRLGMITDFLAEPDTAGDAFVVAPDGSRAGIVWEAECSEPYFIEVRSPDLGRWGVWGVGLSVPLRSKEDARTYLAALVPELRQRWLAWTSNS